jgi:hypothetical protein
MQLRCLQSATLCTAAELLRYYCADTALALNSLATSDAGSVSIAHPRAASASITCMCDCSGMLNARAAVLVESMQITLVCC